MKILVTGAAGFIGSHLAEKLASIGHTIVALDCFLDDSYESEIKRQNFNEISKIPGIIPIQFDLRERLPTKYLDGVDVIVNLAAMPGLMKSWSSFKVYSDCNLLAVQNLIQASIHVGGIPFIQVSTSSVYGAEVKNAEQSELLPISPYGVTKLAAEHLLRAYAQNYGLKHMVLRYFSVYGPRQRPDMAYHIICESILDDVPIKIFGDGSQIRANTFVSDIVDGTILAIENFRPGAILNLSGTESLNLLEAIAILEAGLKRKAILDYLPPRPGDQINTQSLPDLARELIGYSPKVLISEGLIRQAEWHLSRRKVIDAKSG